MEDCTATQLDKGLGDFFLPLLCVLILTDLPCVARWASGSVLAEKAVGAESTWNL